MKYFVLGILSLTLVLGSAYNTYIAYDFSHNTDSYSYMKMARGDLNVNPVHRYRVVIPFLASGIERCVAPFYNSLWEHRPDSQWPLRLGFLVINSLVMALAGVFVFYTCLAYGSGFVTAWIAMSVILASRWANYMAALPITDSLYFLVLALTLYGIRARNQLVLIIAIFVGPFAKESFLFLAPIIFFFGSIPKKRQILFFLISGSIVFGFRWAIDTKLGRPSSESFAAALDHMGTALYSLKRMFLGRIGEKISVIGPAIALIAVGFLGGRNAVRSWAIKLDRPWYGFLLVIAVHVLLSGDVGRMLFLGAPAWAVLLAIILEYHPSFERFRQGWIQSKFKQ